MKLRSTALPAQGVYSTPAGSLGIRTPVSYFQGTPVYGNFIKKGTGRPSSDGSAKVIGVIGVTLYKGIGPGS